VRVAGDGLDLEDTLLNGQEGDIKSSTTEIEDENIALTSDPFTETVGDCGSTGLVDDAEDIQAADLTGILGSLTLGIVKVGGDGNDGVGDGTTKVRLGSLLHLGQDHGGYFLGRLKTESEPPSSLVGRQSIYEFLILAMVLDLNVWFAIFLDGLEGEVLDVGLHPRIGEFTVNETLSAEDSTLSINWL